MGAYIAISEISLQKSKIMNNAHTVYASLIDFFGDTKRDLSNFVDFMEDFNIFNFNNCGKYSGVYRGKHFTFDDGYVDTSKLLNAIDAIDRYNKHYNDDVKLMVHESYILEKDIVNFSLDANLSIAMR